jgi:hypothetical protein
LNETQLEKENKNLEKYMKKARIQEIVIEYGVRDQPKIVNSMGNRLSSRIQNALRREEIEEIEEMTIPMPPIDEEWSFNQRNTGPIGPVGPHDGGIQEAESESRTYDVGGIVESRNL